MPGLGRHLGDTGAHGTGADDGDHGLRGERSGHSVSFQRGFTRIALMNADSCKVLSAFIGVIFINPRWRFVIRR